jgi:hypothetical protein
MYLLRREYVEEIGRLEIERPNLQSPISNLNNYRTPSAINRNNTLIRPQLVNLRF